MIETEQKINSEAEKVQWNKQLEKIIQQEWTPETCIQEFYSTFYVSPHYEMYHRGHEYFITIDIDKDGKQVWIISDRDLTDERFKYNIVWDDEPTSYYVDLPTLIFEYRLKNDGRTIAEYICDYNKTPRNCVPEPMMPSKMRKLWKQ